MTWQLRDAPFRHALQETANDLDGRYALAGTVSAQVHIAAAIGLDTRGPPAHAIELVVFDQTQAPDLSGEVPARIVDTLGFDASLRARTVSWIWRRCPGFSSAPPSPSARRCSRSWPILRPDALAPTLAAALLVACPAPRPPEARAGRDAGPQDASGAGPLIGESRTPDATPSAHLPEAGDVDAGSVADAESAADAAADANDHALCTRAEWGHSAPGATCTRDRDCVLRASECCPPCGPVPRRSIRAAVVGADAICLAECPRCESLVWSNLRAECVKGRCVVVEPLCPTAADAGVR